MDIIIKEASNKDYIDIYNLNKKAFNGIEEAELVENLRKNNNFIKNLSIIAINKNKVVCHILFTKIEIKDENDNIVESKQNILSLAPISVLPEFQNR